MKQLGTTNVHTVVSCIPPTAGIEEIPKSHTFGFMRVLFDLYDVAFDLRASSQKRKVHTSDLQVIAERAMPNELNGILAVVPAPPALLPFLRHEENPTVNRIP